MVCVCVACAGSCSGSGEEEILQSLGERCSCVAGQLVSCCRLRQEWSQLSLAQRQRYIAAVTTVSTDPLYRPAYIQIMQLYLEAFESVVLNEDPQTSQLIVFDDRLKWKSSDLKLLELGAQTLAFSHAEPKIRRIAA